MADWYDKFKKELAASEGVRGRSKAIEGGGPTRGFGITSIPKALKSILIAKGLKADTMSDRDLFNELVDWHRDQVVKTFGKSAYDKLPTSVKGAAIDLHYNLKGSLSAAPSFVRAAKAGNYEDAAKNLLDVVSANDPKTNQKGVLRGLAKRRVKHYNKIAEQNAFDRITNISITPSNQKGKKTLVSYKTKSGDSIDFNFSSGLHSESGSYDKVSTAPDQLPSDDATAPDQLPSDTPLSTVRPDADARARRVQRLTEAAEPPLNIIEERVSSLVKEEKDPELKILKERLIKEDIQDQTNLPILEERQPTPLQPAMEKADLPILTERQQPVIDITEDDLPMVDQRTEAIAEAELANDAIIAKSSVKRSPNKGVLNIYGGPVPLQIPRTIDEFVPISVEEDPTFGETVSATLSYQYAPLFNAIKNNLKYQDIEQVGYKPLDDISGYEEYKSHLYEAKSSQEMAELKQQIDANKERREVLYRASIPMQFAAGIFDPINLVALPFGGPAVGLGRSFLRTGTSVAALQVGLEGIRYPFDPLATPVESAMNVGSAFVTGGMIGTLFSIPASRRAAALEKTNQQVKEFVEITENFTAKDMSLVGDREARKLGGEGDEILNSLRTTLPKTIDGLIKGIDETKSELNKHDGTHLARYEFEGGQETLKKIKEKIKEINDKKESLKKEKVDVKQLKYLDDQIKDLEKSEKIVRKLKNLDDAKVRDSERLQDVKREQQFRRVEGINDGTLKDPFGLADNIFTNSWFYKAIPTPMKSILQGDIPSSIKEKVTTLAGDSAMLQNLNKVGFATPKSVHQYSSTRNGEWLEVYMGMLNNFAQHTKKGVTTVVDINISNFDGSFTAFMKEVNRKYINGEEASSAAEAESIKLLSNFYKKWEKRLIETGLIGTEKSLSAKMIKKEKDLESLNKKIKEVESGFDKAKAGGSERQYAYLKALRERAEQIEQELSALEISLAKMKDDRDIGPQFREEMFPRFWNRDAIRSNRPQFEKILFDWYKNNPDIYEPVKGRVKAGEPRFVKRTLPTDDKSVQGRVESTVDEILGVSKTFDNAADENAFFGAGVSKHFRHRKLDIPNRLVLDFIQNDPLAVMRAYTQRVAPRYEFAKMYGGKSIDDLLLEIDEDMFAAGKSIKQTNAVRKNFLHLYDRVVGNVLRDPTSWDQRVATVLRDFATITYLGSAGFATLPDFAKIMMEHELRDVFRSLYGVMSDDRLKMTTKEGKLAGEVHETVSGENHLRIIDDITNNPFSEGTYSKYMNKVKWGFFQANLLGPFTNIMKKMDVIVRGHSIVQMSIRLSKGTASKFEMEYLARYGIGKKEADGFNKLVDDGIIENTKPDNSGLWLPNTDKWPDEFNALRMEFRSSMNSGIMNTILQSTPADKPIIADGVAYVPHRIAKQFGYDEDPKFRGYSRIENGLLGLPFQFYSYSLAAMNKITASYATGAARNRAVAMATSMGLAYLGMEIKYPDYVMDNMSISDKIARSFDMSGMAALYSDAIYRSMETSMAMGGPDISMGLISPKFPQEKSYIDAATSVLGAGPSWGAEIGTGVKELVTGEYGEGSKRIMRNFPLARLWIWKDLMNEASNSFTARRY